MENIETLEIVTIALAILSASLGIAGFRASEAAKRSLEDTRSLHDDTRRLLQDVMMTTYFDMAKRALRSPLLEAGLMSQIIEELRAAKSGLTVRALRSRIHIEGKENERFMPILKHLVDCKIIETNDNSLEDQAIISESSNFPLE